MNIIKKPYTLVILLSFLIVAGYLALSRLHGYEIQTSALQYSAPNVTINSANDLDIIRSDLAGDYELTTDIDLSSISNFVPLGDENNPFTGTLNGNGHKITGLNINRPNDDFVGLFAVNEGAITNLGIINSKITGRNFVGSISGTNNGTIDKVFSSADVRGKLSVGGLAGQNYYVISNAYTTGNVSGNGSVGAITGYNMGTIEYVYSLSNVTGGAKTGYLVGENTYGSLENSVYGFIGKTFYYASADNTNEINVQSKTFSEMKTLAAYSGFDNAIWEMSFDAEYPYLVLTDTHHENDAANTSDFAGGNGKLYNPYQITNQLSLAKINDYPQSSFKLMNNIKVDNSFVGITSTFYGNLNGNGKTINNLTINNDNANNVGLVSYNNGIIQSAGLIDANITGDKSVGGIVGFNDYGIIYRSFATGNITGDLNVGSLAGYNNVGKIIDVYSLADITGVTNVGGIVGNSYNGIIQNVYYLGNVIGTTNIGGIAGTRDAASFVNAYHSQSKGMGSGTDNATKVSESALLSQGTYSGFDFTDVWAIDTTKAINNGYAYLQGSDFIRVTEVNYALDSKDIVIGETCQLTYDILPIDAFNKNVTFQILTGSDKVTVSSTGLVTGTDIGSATVQITTVDGNFTDVITINVYSANNSKAKNLTVLDEIGTILVLNPSFSSNELNYNIDALLAYDNDEITVNVTKTSDLQSYTIKNITTNTSAINNKLAIIPGINIIEVAVTSSDATETTKYTIKLTREIDPAVAINDIIVSDQNDNVLTLNPSFNSHVINYTVDVGTMLDEIRLLVDTNDSAALVYIDGVLANPNSIAISGLSLGSNLIEVKIVNGAVEQIYTVDLILHDSTNSDLSDLKVFDKTDNDLSLSSNFSDDTLDYIVSDLVDKDNDKVKIVFEKESLLANVTIKNITTGGLATNNIIDVISGENIIEITVTSEDSSSATTYTISLVRAVDPLVALSNITIKDLANNPLPLTPVFNTNNVNYSLEVDVELDSIVINTTADAGAVVTINGEVGNSKTFKLTDLPLGVTNIEIKINNGALEQVYTIALNVLDKTDTSLKNLSILEKFGNLLTLSPDFTSGTLNYIANDAISNDNDKVTVVATKMHDGETVIIKNRTTGNVAVNNTVDLVPGENTLDVIVTSADGSSTTTYSINVTRAVNPLVSLNELKVTNQDDVALTLNPNFNSNIINYTVDVGTMINSINVEAIKTDAGADVYIDGVLSDLETIMVSDLSIGANEIEVKVINGTLEQIYTLNVFVYDSSSTKLTNITVLDENNNELSLTPDFDSNILDYKIEDLLDKDNEFITIIADKLVSTQSVTITNTTTLEENNLLNVIPGVNNINIMVTSEDGLEVATYTITLIREIDPLVILDDLILTDQNTNTLNMNPNFEPNVVKYTLGIASSITEINIDVIPHDASAKVFIDSVETRAYTIDTADLIIGMTTITIKIENGAKVQIYTIDITKTAAELIESDVYNIDREKGYIFTKPNSYISTIKSNLNNPSELIYLVDINGNEITNATKLIGSAVKIQLRINNAVVDELIVILLGDVNGDGIINGVDSGLLKSHLAGQSPITNTTFLKAADVSKENIVNGVDSGILKSHVAGSLSIFA